MTPSVLGLLIRRDLRRFRSWMLAATVLGLIALVLWREDPADGQTTGVNIGMLLYITTLIAYGIFVAMLGLLQEAKDQSRLFLLSLPVSPAQYSAAKVWAAVIAYLLPWSLLLLTALLAPDPGARLPIFVLMMGSFLCLFCLLLCLVAVTLSERWSIVGILVGNLSVPLFLTWLGKLAAASGAGDPPGSTWTAPLLGLLLLQGLLVLLAVGLALYLPARRRDLT